MAVKVGLLILVVFSTVHPGVIGGESEQFTEEEAMVWQEQYNAAAQEIYSSSIRASWAYQTNLTDHNKQIQLSRSLAEAEFDKEAYRNASRFDWRNFQNASLRRIFTKIVDIGTAVLPDDKVLQLNNLESEMQRIYSNAKVCGKPGDADPSKCYPLDPDLTRLMATSRDEKELLWAWRGWREESGKKMKVKYEQFIQLNNEAAKQNNYSDTGEYWRSRYETANFTEECERLFKQVEPLYTELHAYVRRKLAEKYESDTNRFPAQGHIPAHLLGNMWAQTWANMLDILRPYKDKESVDVTEELKSQGYDAKRIFNVSEDFFKSLGMYAMPAEFWEHSMLERPTDRDVVCHASAWDFYDQKNFRIKQCTDITMEDLITAHHEMGHVQYFLQYKHQPVKFRRGANPGFHEAVGDVMSLSVATPEHLHKVGLLKTLDNGTEADINFLLSQALKKIAFLPFGYLIDQWRWKVFKGEVTKDDYNRKWWELRCKYQGISPPVVRTEDQFDPGAKYHIPANTPYIRYFISFIIQFQFHKALCEIAGQLDEVPLHRCDIYNSTEAGSRLGDMLMMGSSQPWPEAMKALTGQAMWDAQPLMDYFKPLTDWLKEENDKHNTERGWEQQCPPGSFVEPEQPTTPSKPISAARVLLTSHIIVMFSCIVSLTRMVL